MILASVVEGEMLTLTKVTRGEMGAYLCIAANGVPPSVSKRMMLLVHCKYLCIFKNTHLGQIDQILKVKIVYLQIF